jgi:hypothetical protein
MAASTARQADASRHRNGASGQERAERRVIAAGSALLGSTHREQGGSTSEILRVQFMALCLEHLLHGFGVAIGACLMAHQHVFTELVDERLTIVEIAEHVLPLLELANSPAAISDARRLRDLHGIPQLLDRDPRRVASTWKIDAGRMVDRVNRRTRSSDERVS